MIIDKNHPKAESTVIRRVKDGTLVPFVVRVNPEEGWFEQNKSNSALQVTAGIDGEVQVVRKKLGDVYEMVTDVPPIIKVRAKDGKMRIFRRADLVPPLPDPKEAAPCTGCPDTQPASHPPFIKVSGKVYQREDLVGK